MGTDGDPTFPRRMDDVYKVAMHPDDIIYLYDNEMTHIVKYLRTD